MSTQLDYPAHLEIARKGTPLQKMKRLSEELGVEIFFKRDDLTGCELSGNKIRKLEFLLADARAKGADTVITCGGAQSNHCRATALAAVRAGLNSTLLLRTEDPMNPPPSHGNILLNRLAGAELVWITPAEYKERHNRFILEQERLHRQGKVAYIIPEGGSNQLGSWGYVKGMEEIANDLVELGAGDFGETTVLSATGSGGTTAGLLLGARLLGLDLRVTGINVCDDEDYFVTEIGRICQGFIKDYSVDIAINSTDIEIVDGYVGRGYALSRQEELKAIYNLAQLEGVVLDPVYTGKAFYGMANEIRKNRSAFGKRIVFVHTGGLFGLFPVADKFEEFF
ncbi:MAG: D-cysteine desulfhydrase family protein [Desulforhopalus sp.]